MRQNEVSMLSGNKDKEKSWKKPEEPGTTRHLLSGVTVDGIGVSTKNLITGEIVIGDKDSHPAKIKTVTAKKIEEFTEPNIETKQLQTLLNALIRNEKVTFEIQKGKKIIAAYGGNKYKLHHLLQAVDWSDIQFNEDDLEKYQDYIFSKDRKFKPTLPKKLKKNQKDGKERDKDLSPPPFTCQCVEAGQVPDIASFFSDKPRLVSAYVIYNNELYYAKNTDGHFEKINVTADQLTEIINNKNLVNDNLIHYINAIVSHDKAKKDKIQHWKSWYHLRANKYHNTHPGSKIHEWHFSEMLGMNIYTTQFYVHANMLLRGNTELLTNNTFKLQSGEVLNEVTKALEKANDPTAVLKEILLTSAVAMHGMHKHLETKQYTVRADEFTNELYASKINKFNILLISLKGELKDVNYFKKLSRKSGGVPVLIKQNNRYFMYGFSDNKWSLKPLDSNVLTAIPQLAFPEAPNKSLLLLGDIKKEIYDEIKLLNCHEKIFNEKSFVSSAHADSSFITPQSLDPKKKADKHSAFVMYEDVEGADVTAISANQHEKEFSIRPGKVKYEAQVSIDGVKTIIGRQIHRLANKPAFMAENKLKRRNAVSSPKKELPEVSSDEKIQTLLSKTPEEQYDNNLKAWAAFLDPDAAKIYGEDYAKRQEIMRRILALLDYLGLGFEDLSHGGRIRIRCDQMQSLFDALINPSVLQARSAASHKIVFKRGQFFEKSLEGGIKAVLHARDYFSSFVNNEHWGMNIGISAEAKAMPANGSYGHLYLNKHFPFKNALGGLLIGLEGSEPGKGNQFGQLHGAAAKKNVLSATGATKNEKNFKAPFHIIHDLHEALEYVENNYKTIEKKWLPTLDQENERLKLKAPKKQGVNNTTILSRTFHYEKVITTPNYETALAEKDKLLAIKNAEPAITLQTGQEKIAAVSAVDQQYHVIPSQHGEMKSVTIHSKNKEIFKSNIFFQDPMTAKENFKHNRQYKIKNFAEHLAWPFKSQTTIPNAECMEWAAYNIGLFLANEQSCKEILKHGIKCYNMSREQIEAIQIYCKYYSKNNLSQPIKCHSAFRFEEKTLDKQASLYESLIHSEERLTSRMKPTRAS